MDRLSKRDSEFASRVRARFLFPSRSASPTRAAFAPPGPGAQSVPRPHRSYAALRLPCRFGMPPVCPRPCLTSRGSLGAPAVGFGGYPSQFPAGPQSDSHSHGSESPLHRGRTGTSQVTGPSSSAVPRSTTPPVPLRLAIAPPGVLPSGYLSPWASGMFNDFGAAPLGPPARLATLQPPPRGGRLQAWLPACRLRFGWVGIAPTGRLIRVLVYIPTSSLTGMAWSLPGTRCRASGR